MKIIYIIFVVFSLPFSRTTGGLIIRVFIAFFIPPLSVFIALLSKGRNPLSNTFWINFALMALPLSPFFSIIHAIHFNFIRGEEYPITPNTPQSLPVNTTPSNSPARTFLSRNHTRVSILALVISCLVSLLTTYIAWENLNIARENFKHQTQMNFPAKHHQQK